MSVSLEPTGNLFFFRPRMDDKGDIDLLKLGKEPDQCGPKKFIVGIGRGRDTWAEFLPGLLVGPGRHEPDGAEIRVRKNDCCGREPMLVPFGRAAGWSMLVWSLVG